MKTFNFDLYPRVYKADERATVSLDIGDMKIRSTPEIRISGMEIYTLPHTRKHRIDEEERNPYYPMKQASSGVYTFDFDFVGEQKYSVTVRIGDEEYGRAYVYSLGADLYGLMPLKGDTHLHTSRSDGEGTPTQVSLGYRASGFDFIAITDHHKFAPSKEAREVFLPLTDEFRVYLGEEVHNHDMGYFHIINFGGSYSVNDIIEAENSVADAEVAEILATRSFDGCADPYECAYRIFVSENIRRSGGVSILAHPFWESYGEYNMQTRDLVYLLKNNCFDAFEVIAGCDADGNGNNLQMALLNDLRAEGVRTPIVGSSDAHATRLRYDWDKFNLQFTIVFAKNIDEVKEAILDQRSVAVRRDSDVDFFVYGSFRLSKYARFLMNEYFPRYTRLCKEHSELLALVIEDEGMFNALRSFEKKLADFKHTFFGF